MNKKDAGIVANDILDEIRRLKTIESDVTDEIMRLQQLRYRLMTSDLDGVDFTIPESHEDYKNRVLDTHATFII